MPRLRAAIRRGPRRAGSSLRRRDAIAQAGLLLKFTTDAEDLPHAGMVAPGIKLMRPVKDPIYGGMLDVLEMYGNNYKTTYRIRLLYVRIEGPPAGDTTSSRSWSSATHKKPPCQRHDGS